MSLNYLICLIGLPGSGKTTLSSWLVKNNNDIKLYEYDIYKKNTSTALDKETHQQMKNNIYKDILLGQNVLIDDLHLTKSNRAFYMSLPCKKIAIIMTTSLEECCYRNAIRNRKDNIPDNLIINLYKKFEPPSYDEGWDEIYYCYEKE